MPYDTAPSGESSHDMQTPAKSPAHQQPLDNSFAQAGVPLAEGMFRPLSAPVEAWHFDMACPPEDSGRRTLDVEFAAGGVCNSVVFWFELQLCDGVVISSAPQQHGHASSPGGHLRMLQLIRPTVLYGAPCSDHTNLLVLLGMA